jgi:hypothetical protein
VENFPGQYTNNDPGAQMRATIRVEPQAGSMIDTTVRNALQFPLPPPAGTDDTAIGANSGANGQVTVLLRRLANPYLPPNDPMETNAATPYNPAAPYNPYVTVDVAESVPTANNVHFSSSDVPPTNRNPPIATSASTGREHPFAAAVTDPQATDVPPGTPASPRSTFFNHNDNSGLTVAPVTPLKWLTHLDRQVVSPVELAHVSAVAPGSLTTTFGLPGPTPADPASFNRHSIEKLLLAGVFGGVDPTGNPTPPPPGYLARDGFFDVFQARGPQSAAPVGGRTHGKINLNAAWHPSVLRALLDRNDANFFRDADVSGTPTAAWERMTAAATGLRSPAFPNVSPIDAPFRGLGDVVQRGFNPTGTPPTLPLFFNQDPTDANPANVPPVGLPASAVDHTAVLAEPLRKMLNNVTTTSDGFLVIMTVAFFEVRNDPATTPGGRVYLGKELYEQVPGDRRYRFVSIVDRTQLALDPTPTTATPPLVLQAPSTPWQTTLAEDVLPGATTIKVMAATNNPTNDPNVVTNARVFADGVPVDLLAVTTPPTFQRIRVGFGDAGLPRPLTAQPGPPPVPPAVSPASDGGDGEELALASLPPPTPTPIPQVVAWANGVATITLAAPAVRYHPAGSPVTNHLLGNPGPQPNFDPNDTRYKPVVPYFARVTGSQ